MNSHNPVSKCAADLGIVPLTREKNGELYAQLRETNGDEQEAIVQKMIEGNMALVFGRVNDFIDDFPKFNYLRDDLISECFLALTRAVRVLAAQDQQDDPNPVGFISYSLYHSNLDLAFADGTIPVSRFVQWKYRMSNSDLLDRPQVAPLDGNNSGLADLNEYRRVECLENIHELCTTDKESQIVNLRLAGHTDQEIADILNVDRTMVLRIRQRLYEQYQQDIRKS